MVILLCVLARLALARTQAELPGATTEAGVCQRLQCGVGGDHIVQCTSQQHPFAVYLTSRAAELTAGESQLVPEQGIMILMIDQAILYRNMFLSI